MTAGGRSRNNRGTRRIGRRPSGGIIVEVVSRSAINGDGGRKRFVCAGGRGGRRGGKGTAAREGEEEQEAAGGEKTQ